MHSLSADNWHIGRYIVQSADDRIYADYLQYRIGRISLSANFPNLDIVCTPGPGLAAATATAAGTEAGTAAAGAGPSPDRLRGGGARALALGRGRTKDAPCQD